MKRIVLAALIAVFGGLLLANVRAADDKDKPKYTIKEVMKLHAKEKLHEKFIKGEATKEEKQKLLEAYEAMGKNKPPKGDEKSWKEKCDALVKAVKEDEKDKDKEAFKKAVNCKACHEAHKG